MKKYSGCMCTFANQIKTIKLLKYEKMQVQLLKGYRIKFQKFAAHAHTDALINETFIPT